MHVIEKFFQSRNVVVHVALLKKRKNIISTFFDDTKRVCKLFFD